METEEFSDEESMGLFSLLYRSQETKFLNCFKQNSYSYGYKKLSNN